MRDEIILFVKIATFLCEKDGTAWQMRELFAVKGVELGVKMVKEVLSLQKSTSFVCQYVICAEKQNADVVGL